MSIARLKEFLGQIIVPVWGENVLRDTVISTGPQLVFYVTFSLKWRAAGLRACPSETHLSSRGVMRRALHFSKVLLLGYYPHVRGALLNQREITLFFHHRFTLCLSITEHSRGSFWMSCNHWKHKRLTTHPNRLQRGCYCITWHVDPMGSVELGLRSLDSEHHRDKLRQTASDRTCAWRLRSDAQLQTVSTDPATGRLKLGCFY